MWVLFSTSQMWPSATENRSSDIFVAMGNEWLRPKKGEVHMSKKTGVMRAELKRINLAIEKHERRMGNGTQRADTTERWEKLVHKASVLRRELDMIEKPAAVPA